MLHSTDEVNFMNPDDFKRTTRSVNGDGSCKGFCCVVAVIDLALGLWISYLGAFILFLRRGADIFTVVGDEWWGLLLAVHGIWALYAGYRLITQRTATDWQEEKRRHLVCAVMSALVIALMWLALMVDSHDGFGPAMGTLIYSVVFGAQASFWIIVSMAMSRKGRIPQQSP